MATEQLLSRADKVRAQFREWETHKQPDGTRGYGYHDTDVDLSQKHQDHRLQRKVAPQMNGLPKASESAVYFHDHEDLEQIHFVGPDADRVFKALQAWLGKPKGKLHSMTGTLLKLTTEIVPKMKLENHDGTPWLTFWLCDWNDVVYALNEMKVGICGAPLVHDGDPETP